jgi:hypothetical protein
MTIIVNYLITAIVNHLITAIDNQDPRIDTNPQNNTSKADNEIYAQNYGDDFSDYVEFASENYGDGLYYQRCRSFHQYTELFHLSHWLLRCPLC